MHRITLLAAAMLAAGWSAHPASGQDSPDPAPLSGPRVKEHAGPASRSAFTDNKQARAALPPQVLREALDSLDSEQTPPEIRLTDAQKETIRGLIAGHRREVAAYKAEHAAEIAECRRELGEDKPRKEGAPRDQMARPESERAVAARERLAQIQRNAPDPADAYAQVWRQLTPAQQSAVQARIDAHVKSREEARAREYVRKRMKSQDGAATDAGRVPPRLRERLANLPPEERARAIEEFRRRQSEGGGRDKPRKIRPPGKPKPPPKMDEVAVPPPEDR